MLSNRGLTKFKLFLEKPDGTNLGQLNAYNIKIKFNGRSKNELTFDLPERIANRIGEFYRNPYVDFVKDKYIVNLEIDNESEVLRERFQIILPDKLADGSLTTHSYIAYSEDFKEAGKAISGFIGVEVDANGDSGIVIDSETGAVTENAVVSTNPKTYSKLGLTIAEVLIGLARQVKSYYTIAFVDPSLANVVRSDINISNSNFYQEIWRISEKYNAIPIFDNITKNIGIFILDNIGENTLLNIEFGKYLKILNKKSNSENIVTRMRANGANNLTINSVTTTGFNYVEDYSYYLGSFDPNTGTPSEWMSNSLATALTNYSALVESQKVPIENKLQQYNNTLEELNSANTQLDYLISGGSFVETKDAVAGGSIFVSIVILDRNAYIQPDYGGVGLVDELDGSGAFVKRYTYDMTDREYPDSPSDDSYYVNVSETDTLDSRTLVFRRTQVDVGTSVRVSYTSLGRSQLQTYIDILVTEKNNGNPYDATLLSRYQAWLNSINSSIASIESYAAAKESELAIITAELDALYATMDIDANFTPAQQQEWDNFIVESIYTNTSITDPELLKKATESELATRNIPELTISADIISILQTRDGKADWDKIKLFNYIDIFYDRIGVDVRVQILEIDIDVDNYKMSLVTSNTINYFKDSSDYLKAFLDDGYRTKVAVTKNQQTWDMAEQNSSDIVTIQETPVDNVVAGVGSSVQIDENAIKISRQIIYNEDGVPVTNTAAATQYIKITNGAIVLYDDTGTYQTAITNERIIANVIKGNLLIGEELNILGKDGTDDVIEIGYIDVDGDGTDDDFGIKITGYDSTVEKTKIIMGKENGFRIDDKDDVTRFQVDNDGVMNLLSGNNKPVIDRNKVVQTIGYGYNVSKNITYGGVEENYMLMPTINLGGKFFNIGVCAFFNTNGLPYNAGDKIKVNCDLKFIYSGGDVTVGSVEIEITVTVAGTYSLVYNFPSLDRGIDTTGFRGAIATITNVNGILGINFEHISIAFNGYSAIEES